MDDLAERIEGLLSDPKSDPWFPELTSALVDRAWQRFHDDIGLTPSNYGTERVKRRSVSAPRDIIASLPAWSSPRGGASTIDIETLSEQFTFQYHKAGVSFYSRKDIINSEVLACIEDALRTLNQVPSLMQSVASLVRSLHVIVPPDLDHDVSFSEPEIPFSIFVSVPKSRVLNDSLRVAEAFVHEAMHLQLTQLERILPLVSSIRGKYYSPWRGEYRNAQGVLHALYVFHVIAKFLGRSTLSADGNIERYAFRRRSEIDEGFRATLSFGHCAELTPLGRVFVRRLQRDLSICSIYD